MRLARPASALRLELQLRQSQSRIKVFFFFKTQHFLQQAAQQNLGASNFDYPSDR